MISFYIVYSIITIMAFFRGLGSGLAGMFGLGSLVSQNSELTKLHKELSKSTQELNAVFQAGTLSLLSQEQKNEEQLNNVINAQSRLNDMRYKYEEILNQANQTNAKFSTMILLMLIFLILLYLILKR